MGKCIGFTWREGGGIAMPVRILLLVIALAVTATAETFTYVVFRHKCYPNDKYIYDLSPIEEKRFVDAGKITINSAGGQPFRMTTYALNFDGKYATLNIDDANEPPQSKGFIRGMVANGCAVLISTQEVVTTYEPRLGGNVTDFVYKKLGEYPTDYYEVDPSSAT
jgi:hypothetical protein